MVESTNMMSRDAVDRDIFVKPYYMYVYNKYCWPNNKNFNSQFIKLGKREGRPREKRHAN